MESLDLLLHELPRDVSADEFADSADSVLAACDLAMPEPPPVL